MSIAALKEIDVRTVNRDTLVDRSTVSINKNIPRHERLQDFIEQIKNPYCYKDGKAVVKISFSNMGRTLDQCVAHYLQGL